MKWLADENFRSAIIRGILRHRPAIDVARVQDIADISGRDDAAVLSFATREGRVLVTHDVSTMIPAMLDQLERESKCAPIVFVPDSLPASTAIEDLLLLDDCAVEADWAAGVIYIPLR